MLWSAAILLLVVSGVLFVGAKHRRLREDEGINLDDTRISLPETKAYQARDVEPRISIPCGSGERG